MIPVRGEGTRDAGKPVRLLEFEGPPLCLSRIPTKTKWFFDLERAEAARSVPLKIPVRGEGTREAGGTGRLVPGGPGSKGGWAEQKAEASERSKNDLFGRIKKGGRRILLLPFHNLGTASCEAIAPFGCDWRQNLMGPREGQSPGRVNGGGRKRPFSHPQRLDGRPARRI